MKNIATRAEEFCRSTSARAMVLATGLMFGSPSTALASQWFGTNGGTANVNPSNLNADAMINKVVTIAINIPRIYGLIQFIMGVVTFFNEGHNDNPAGQAKAGKQMAFGLALIMVPTLLKWVIGG